ncbi:sodium- and chloride-dependent betaine transporter-like [Solea solea]|uniref:sodium- and chloride-dependent betaine transporter-like n=1 Tax=Solea solea TaxID=90069 RepID=UPI00272D268B|nr:sodium- and chloride-dependent betaine transporter-like [Solea solea]XP_058480130.1 sodium- and chloride-dependent betaine transporter-like [Solea solea]
MTPEETARGASTRSMGPEKGISEDGAHPRAKWGNKMAFMFSAIGVMVGPGTISRFPFYLSVHGGVVFLIPYCFMLYFCGFPLFFMELALGQYTSEGAVTAWRKICPMFEGVGVACQVYVFYIITYFIVIIAWVIFYFIYSFMSPLAWSTCDNWWNSGECKIPTPDWSFINSTITAGDYDPYYNISVESSWPMSADNEFWQLRVIRQSPDFSLGVVHWDMALCLLAAWVICYFCVFKGIKYTGMVVYLTATLPYLIMVIFFFRVVTLPGALSGLEHYFYPNLDVLADINIWLGALTLVMYTVAVSHGVMIALGSYNKYNNDCYRDSYTLFGVTIATNLAFTVVVSSLMGFLAEVRQMSVHEVLATGPGQIFQAIPVALAHIPGAHFWAVLFFLMMFFLNIDTQFLYLEGLVTAVTDMFPHRLRGRREKLTLVIVVVCFLLGLPFITEGGLLLFYLVDHFAMNVTCYFFIACFETVIIGWVYGADRFLDNIEDMIGYRPYPVIKYCWLFVTPLVCGVAFRYHEIFPASFWFEDYEPSLSYTIFGAILMVAPLICIPVYILLTLCRNGNNMATPSSNLRQARPHKPLLSLCKRVIFSAPPTRTVDEGNEKIMMGEPSGV